MTYTYALLEISAQAWDEIAAKLRAAGYDHVFDVNGTDIDMHGIGLSRGPVAETVLAVNAAKARKGR